MTNSKGFTLIELVVVIVILGILSVTAAPKFLNLQRDARIASLQGAKGAIAGANSIVYGKAAINGVETVVELDGAEIGFEGTWLSYGYMQAHKATLQEFVIGFEDETMWTVIDDNEDEGNRNTRIWLADTPTHNDTARNKCYIQYEQSLVEGVAPRILLHTDEC
ncbi:hypothetical protein A9264_13595 [Vibrio sp. UCD-FRSSP16_10]|uniref:type II secretion system protein n=1 Tax=unclassified Vibrio TaxID=2614977 RepID=UPI000800F19E|nr:MULTISPECIES: type II secretion system protein [unclassified Vibrio]OBT14805.1 hypothetical protein A9260_13810 [Vibrio sp. UCD-FRSSP16_30]OBT20094.1 hypothetical protein A9264_13595 [Vibrio sp. UCD-FRSSP16_10]